MSDSARKKQRTSPRVSDATKNPSTLYTDLQRLATIAPKPVTPYRRATSAGAATPGSRSIRTPGTARTPRGEPATRPISRRAAPTTPHAIRALRERADAARTPGRVRRRSGRVQRETPRDILRDLSRVLARETRPTEPSPLVPSRPSRQSALDLPDLEDGPEPVAPRLSIPLGDMYDDDDDSIHEAPPRQSLLPHLPDDADNGTIQSLEFGRRALSEDPRLMYGGRVSERFADLSELGMDGDDVEVDGIFVNRRRTINLEDILDQVPEEEGDETTTQMMLTGRRGGRPSDVDLGVFGEVEDETEEPTFRFTIPPRMQAALPTGGEEEVGVGDVVDQTILEDEGEPEHEDLPFAGDDPNQDETAGLVVDNDTTILHDDQQLGWESDPDPDADADADLQAYREEISAIDRSLQTESSPSRPTPRAKKQRRALNISRFGREYPSVPAATVKMLATGFLAKSQSGKSKISKDTLEALVQTSDFFFEQVGEDLAAYAQHGGRKVIEEADVVALMKRTRLITDSNTVFSLAQKFLPRELMQQLRMPPPSKLKNRTRK